MLGLLAHIHRGPVVGRSRRPPRRRGARPPHAGAPDPGGRIRTDRLHLARAPPDGPQRGITVAEVDSTRTVVDGRLVRADAALSAWSTTARRLHRSPNRPGDPAAQFDDEALLEVAVRRRRLQLPRHGAQQHGPRPSRGTRRDDCTRRQTVVRDDRRRGRRRRRRRTGSEDPRVAGAILEALETHGVLVFRGLHLDPEHQVAFCRHLGEVDGAISHHPVPGHLPGHAGHDEERQRRVPARDLPLAHRRVHARGRRGAADGDDALGARGVRRGWRHGVREHLRGVRRPVPPTQGAGPTRSAPSTRIEASQRRVSRTRRDEQIARWRARPTSEFPLVWTHHDGRRSLVIGASCDHVVGMDVDESRVLLDRPPRARDDRSASTGTTGRSATP